MASSEVTKVNLYKTHLLSDWSYVKDDFFIFVSLQDAENTHFYSFELVKMGNAPENIKTFGLQLKPCVYKKRWSHVMKTSGFETFSSLDRLFFQNSSCTFYVNVSCLLHFEAYTLSQSEQNFLLYLYMFSIDIQVHADFLPLSLDEDDQWNNPVRMKTYTDQQFSVFSYFFFF